MSKYNSPLPLSDIIDIMYSHSMWLKTRSNKIKEGKRADFTNHDLSGMDFSKVNLSYALIALIHFHFIGQKHFLIASNNNHNF